MTYLTYSLILILVSIINTYLSLKKKLLLTSINCIVFIVLIAGQSLWLGLSFDVDHIHTLFLNVNSFRREYAILATQILILFQIVFLFLLVACFPNYEESKNNILVKKISYVGFAEFSFLSLVSILVPTLLVINAGGAAVFFLTPGSLISGQAFLILSLGLLKWSLLVRQINGYSASNSSVFFFIVYLFFALFTSRFLTIFALIQCFIFQHYYVNRINIKQLFTLGIIGFAILIGYGLFRDAAHRASYGVASIHSNSTTINDFIYTTFNWFYNKNIEAFSGMSEAIDYLEKGGKSDFAVEEIKNILNLIPAYFRNSEYWPFARYINYIEFLAAPYHSVVKSSYEAYLLGFGYSGIILFFSFYLWILYNCEKSLCEKKKGVYAVFSIQTLNLHRDTIFHGLFFYGFADYLGYVIISRFIKK